MKFKQIILVLFLFVFITSPVMVYSQVLGACGSPNENEPGAALKTDTPVKASEIQQVLRPGDRAVNFELPAVVGDEIKPVKLSDYNGKWRVVCFYPADFTFV